jgi:hypothetical protein
MPDAMESYFDKLKAAANAEVRGEEGKQSWVLQVIHTCIQHHNLKSSLA